MRNTVKRPVSTRHSRKGDGPWPAGLALLTGITLLGISVASLFLEWTGTMVFSPGYGTDLLRPVLVVFPLFGGFLLVLVPGIFLSVRGDGPLSVGYGFLGGAILVLAGSVYTSGIFTSALTFPISEITAGFIWLILGLAPMVGGFVMIFIALKSV